MSVPAQLKVSGGRFNVISSLPFPFPSWRWLAYEVCPPSSLLRSLDLRTQDCFFFFFAH